MKVICIYNKGSELPENERIKYGFGVDTSFNLKSEREYTIYGMCLFEGGLRYLTVGESYKGIPAGVSWYPSVLFEIKDPKVSECWSFSCFNEEGLTAIWGYNELVNDMSHYEALITGGEGSVEHLKIFQERKKEIDAEYAEEG